MGLSFEEAYRILELPRGSSQDEIRASYKRLALKWHPDKHGNSTEATEKFQEVSSAYKRLTSTDDEADIVMTPADMFDLFAHIFFANGMFGCMHRHDSDYDDEFTDDDSEEDEFLGGIANRLRRKYERYEKSAEKRTSAHNLSEAEAMRNAEELIQEEEKERKRAEKRRAKKKRNKERKKQKDKEKEKETRKDGKENRQDTVGGGDIQNNSISKNSTEKKNNNNLSNDTNNSKKSSSKKNGLREKTSNEQNPQTSKKEPGQNKSRHDEDSDSHTEEPDWDTSSAFFAHAAGQPVPGQSVSKSSPNSNTNDIQVTSAPTQKQPECTDNRNGSLPIQGSKSDHVDPLVIKSRQVAVRGNEMANAGNYQAAVELFTEAIELDSRDFRFFGNRSYCFDRMGQYEKALQDANLAITLAPDWPKGYFRRGRALAGLKLFSDAESSFSQVLKLDKHCEDAMFELARVRVQQLEEMGFPFAESEAAIQAYGTVQAALEALLAGKVKVTVTEEIYMSDGETDSPSSKNRISENTGQCQALWVGNVDPEQVNEKHLVQLFSRCAKVDNVRLLPKRFCAFVNFVTPEGAAAALEKMQGYEIGGQNLLLRYPNNTGAPGTENAPLRKPVAPTSVVSQPSYSQPRLPSTQASKVTGPVNGDECYFWRTSGCAFGDKCKYNHIPAHKAVDLRKVEAKYGGRLRLQNPNTKS